MRPIETFEYKGYTVEIHTDEDPSSPREDDNPTTMICFHPNYKLGDERSYSQSEFNDGKELEARIKQDYDVKLIKPLYLLDHSGITIRTGRYASDPGGWDTSFVGFVFIEAKRAEMCGTPPELFDEALEADVRAYANYLEGGYVGYVIKAPATTCKCCGHTEKDKVLDSLWGIDDIKYARSEAKSYIDSIIKHGDEPSPKPKDAKQLAAKLAKYYTKKFNGTVTCYWEDERGAFSISGSQLPATQKLQAQYPNGWSMLDHVSLKKARRLVKK
jgi:hypothetical protein